MGDLVRAVARHLDARDSHSAQHLLRSSQSWAVGWLRLTQPSAHRTTGAVRSGWPMWLRSMAWQSATSVPPVAGICGHEESRSPRTTRSGCLGPSAPFFAMRRSGAGARGGSIPIESLPPRGRSKRRLVRSHASSRMTSGRSFCGPVSIWMRATYRPPGGTH